MQAYLHKRPPRVRLHFAIRLQCCSLSLAQGEVNPLNLPMFSHNQLKKLKQTLPKCGKCIKNYKTNSGKPLTKVCETSDSIEHHRSTNMADFRSGQEVMPPATVMITVMMMTSSGIQLPLCCVGLRVCPCV